MATNRHKNVKPPQPTVPAPERSDVTDALDVINTAQSLAHAVFCHAAPAVVFGLIQRAPQAPTAWPTFIDALKNARAFTAELLGRSAEKAWTEDQADAVALTIFDLIFESGTDEDPEFIEQLKASLQVAADVAKARFGHLVAKTPTDPSPLLEVFALFFDPSQAA